MSMPGSYLARMAQQSSYKLKRGEEIPVEWNCGEAFIGPEQILVPLVQP
jgi:hypothetical protein